VVEDSDDPIPAMMPWELVHARTAGLDVFTTHLAPAPHHGRHRRLQVLEIDRLIRNGRGDQDDFDGGHREAMPPILTGDFNAEPESDEIRFLRGFTVLQDRTTFMQDAWAVAGDGGPGYTNDWRRRMITSLHVAKLGPQAAIFRPPKAGSISGLVQADGGVTTRLGSSFLPAFDLTRAVLVARWKEETALDDFEANHPLGKKFMTGWSTRLDAVRATGAWPGVSDELPKVRKATSADPVVVVTQSHLNFAKAVPFLKANAIASANIMKAEGLLWACAYAGPPRFGTVSVWQSEEQMVANAYGEASPDHERAMKEERAKSFFKESVYTRLRPRSVSGSVAGKNPIPSDLLDF